MLETGRRTAISTSELGLYSDRVDRYHRNRYSPIVRKFVIGIMVVVAVILVAVFLYDFTFAASTHGKLSQETKHIYILQNALKKPANASRKSAGATASPELRSNGTDITFMQDRSDDDDGNAFSKLGTESDLASAESHSHLTVDPEFRAQNLNNLKLRKRVLKSIDGQREDEPAENKQLFDNHALVYRVRQRYKQPDLEEEDEEASSEENRPTPFHWEFKTPLPSSFKRLKYPQLSQYRYPQSSRNIQDIIKYLTNDRDVPNRGIKFSGVYVNPKKYDLYSDIGEMMSNSDRSEEEESSPFPGALNGDPFYQYKPKHPADVNLLATSNVRFSPTGVHRYNPYYDPFYNRPLINYNKPSALDPQFENTDLYSTNYGKKRKPKPFSVMLDIYPITDIDPSKKATRPRPQLPLDDYDARRPIQFNRGPKLYAHPSGPIPVVAIPTQPPLTDEEERQQMVFHLNLYPRRKNKLSRHEIIHRSESMQPEERQQLMDKIMSPLESIAKHLTVHSAIEQAKVEETKFAEAEALDSTGEPITRYQEAILDTAEGNSTGLINGENGSLNSDNTDVSQPAIALPLNHKISTDEDYASTEKYDLDAQKMIVATTESEYDDKGTARPIQEELVVDKNESTTAEKDVDTVEGFQRFNDGLLAVE